MKKVFTQALFTLPLLFGAAKAWAQPANDLPCNAIAIVMDAVAIQYDNTDATSEANEPGPTIQNCQLGWCELDVDSTIWFTFVAPANGAVEVNSCLPGPSHDLQVAVYEVTDCADYATYTLKGANDDTPGGCQATGASIFSSTLHLDGLTPGATYYLQCDGYNGAIGPFLLEITTSTPLCKMKLVNNCADALATSVDVYIDDQLVADNLLFRTGTAFFNAVAQEEVTIAVCDAASTDASNPLYTQTVTLDMTKDYIAIASGILSATGYSPNVPFTLHLFDMAVMANPTTDQFSLLLYHGSTDAPTTVDLEDLNDGTTLYDNAEYGTFYNNSYSNVPAGLYSIDITDMAGTPLGLPYCLPLEFAPNTLIVIASGFVNPADNSNGPAFGLFTVANNFAGTFAPGIFGGCVAPLNDMPCNAADLVVNAPPTAGSNMFATAEPDEVHPGGGACQDPMVWCAFDSLATISVWYKFVATNTVATVSTCLPGTSLDSQVAIYSVGNCSDYTTYTLLAANDDTPGGCPAANTTFASYQELTGLTIGNTYYVQVDGYGGSDNPFNIQVSAPDNVGEYLAASFRVFPNPAKDVLNVAYSGKGLLQIFDARGALAQKAQANGNTTINISTLPAGMYTITLADGAHTTAQRFVVE
ncbi:MAG: T9SS type A sorting domain-containing protein [Flavobacteriales bacterium]